MFPTALVLPKADRHFRSAGVSGLHSLFLQTLLRQTNYDTALHRFFSQNPYRWAVYDALLWCTAGWSCPDRPTGPKRYPDSPKSIPDRNQIDPCSTQLAPQVDPNSTRSDLNPSDPRSIPNRTQIGPCSIQIAGQIGGVILRTGQSRVVMVLRTAFCTLCSYYVTQYKSDTARRSANPAGYRGPPIRSPDFRFKSGGRGCRGGLSKLRITWRGPAPKPPIRCGSVAKLDADMLPGVHRLSEYKRCRQQEESPHIQGSSPGLAQGATYLQETLRQQT